MLSTYSLMLSTYGAERRSGAERRFVFQERALLMRELMVKPCWENRFLLCQMHACRLDGFLVELTQVTYGAELRGLTAQSTVYLFAYAEYLRRRAPCRRRAPNLF